MCNVDYSFLFSNLVQKNVNIRHRNMSLGMWWLLLNSLVMMELLPSFLRVFFQATRSMTSEATSLFVALTSKPRSRTGAALVGLK